MRIQSIGLKINRKNPHENIIKTTKPGVKGIWEVLEP